jgi:hypothetical protein
MLCCSWQWTVFLTVFISACAIAPSSWGVPLWSFSRKHYNFYYLHCSCVFLAYLIAKYIYICDRWLGKITLETYISQIHIWLRYDSCVTATYFFPSYWRHFQFTSLGVNNIYSYIMLDIRSTLIFFFSLSLSHSYIYSSSLFNWTKNAAKIPSLCHTVTKLLLQV